MNVERNLRTWGRSKSVRLRGFDYRTHAPYHVTTRARDGTAPFWNAALATMACRQIRLTRDALKFYVGAFCLMPDHLHLLVSPDRSGLPLGEMMGRYKGHTTNASWQLGWNGKLWKPRFHDRIVRVSEGIAPVAKYIYENPERKGIDSSWP